MDDPRELLIGIALVIIIVAGVYFYTRPQPAAVEIVNLNIGGYGTKATTTSNSYTAITFELKHNDGLNHTVTVLFRLTTEGARYVSITTAVGGKPLPTSGDSFYYNTFVYAADVSRPQKVFAWTHMSGVQSVSVEIIMSLLVDNKPVGGTSTVTLSIST